VVPIVRAHHEKWDGSGYPDGLKGEQIPIGARILTAVDCLDALASDRQYRKALPLDEAMQSIANEAGSAFDPRIVEVLQLRYRDLEELTLHGSDRSASDSLNLGTIASREVQPGSGYQREHTDRSATQTDFLASIASARQEAHTLFELGQDLGNSLSLDETLSLVAMRLRKLVPYASIVVFVRQEEKLIPEFVSGDHYRLLSTLKIEIGSGLCGWVARNVRPIINGNPAVEEGFEQAAHSATPLQSALAVPLEGVSGLVGVLALYQSEPDAFTSDHLRILQVITSKVALFVENALKYRAAENSATIDYLTGMSNARALSVYLEQELVRCRREKTSLTIMVTDLNGFKQVNDCYGHQAGDKVLKLFGSLVHEACRQTDYVARMGGDEFVIVAANMTLAVVSERAEQLSALAQRAGREVCGKDFLSLSLGAAFFPQDGSDAEELLAEADRKMYAAKHLFHRQREAAQSASSAAFVEPTQSRVPLLN
jgi:diguanylate cyclase (GGDEF)-like protein